MPNPGPLPELEKLSNYWIIVVDPNLFEPGQTSRNPAAPMQIVAGPFVVTATDPEHALKLVYEAPDVQALPEQTIAYVTQGRVSRVERYVEHVPKVMIGWSTVAPDRQPLRPAQVEDAVYVDRPGPHG